MLLIFEVVIAVWAVIAVGLAVWTYHNAWMLAFSRGWAAVSLVLGPVGLAVYLLRSRYAGMGRTAVALPGYEMRQVTERERGGGRKAQSSVSSGTAAERTASGEFESTDIRQGLPRCPRCSTAVSFYDVKCIKCGQLIKPAITSSSF